MCYECDSRPDKCDEDINPNFEYKSKKSVQHILHLSDTLQILKFFGLNNYAYDTNLNRIANTLSDCIYLINNPSKL